MNYCPRYGLIFTLVLMAYAGLAQSQPNRPYRLGEVLKWKISYGWFNIGKADVTINQSGNGSSDHIMAQTTGQAAGLISTFADLSNEYNSLIDTRNWRPVESSKKVREGKRSKDLESKFNYDSGFVKVHMVNYMRDLEENKVYEINDQTYDILSTYLYYRNKPFHEFNKGDSSMIKIFFEKKLYDFGIEYAGIEEISYDGNDIEAHKLYILLPVSSVFPKERTVMVWITADEYQIPLKLRAQMRFGKVLCELSNFDELKDFYRQN